MEFNDDDIWQTRLKRYGNLSQQGLEWTVQWLMMKMKGQDPQGSDTMAQLMTHGMGQLKGPLMKIAQFLSTVPDALPPEYAEKFSTLQSHAPPMGWPFVQRRMSRELGPQWQSLFASFDQKSCAAASLGQVHKAQKHDGTWVACKLQYPDMSSAVTADLNQLKIFLKIYEKGWGTLKTSEVYEEIADRLREELDYTLEARHTKMYQHMLRDQDDIHIPWVIEELSTKRLLTTQWIEGCSIREFFHQSQDIRNHWASLLFKGWYRPLYSYGMIHGDPHMGNYLCDQDRLVILDFGCVRAFSGKFVQGIIDLRQALLQKDEAKMVHAYESWGFSCLTRDLIDALNLWANLLYDPLLDDRVRPLQKDHRGIEAKNRIVQVHEALKKAGGVRPPREFIFMDRASVGIGSVCMALRAELNWSKMFDQLIQDFSWENMDIRQKKLYEDFPIKKNVSD